MDFDQDHPSFEVCAAYVAVAKGEPYDLDALRSALRARSEQPAAVGDRALWDEYVRRSCQQLIGVVDLVEAEDFDAAYEALGFAIRW